MFDKALIVAVAFCGFQLQSVVGHGRLWTPVARGSAWRKGFSTPADYTDNEEFCGGFAVQWETNNGDCGVCGDRADGPFENQTPGRYATGTIVANYQKGQTIDVQVQVTANHKGWFEFKLCENNDVANDKDQACFDKHLLEFEDGSKRVNVSSGLGMKSYRVKLPADVTCDQCILQWHYNTGNSWGVDPGATQGCLGCGKQETFMGCSDIRIVGQGTGPDGDVTTPPAPPTTQEPELPTTNNPQQPTTANPGGGGSSGCKATGAWTGDSSMDEWCVDNCALGNCPPSHCTCQDSPDPTAAPAPGCKATGPWTGQSAIDQWCVNNCANGYCPDHMCRCD